MKKIHFENLDAWRFVAFFSVFIFHALASKEPAVKSNEVYSFLQKITSHGHLGVNFFFVLSGFLITYLLMAEEQAHGRYNIKDFWIRRALRIWPLYFAVLFYSFLVFRFLYTFLTHNAYHEPANPVYYLFFLPNFDLIANGHPLENCLSVLWSVGVEEQFYLFWPLLFFIKSIRVGVMLLIIISSVMFKYFHAHEAIVSRFHTFSVMGNLAFGCLLAYYSFTKQLQVKSVYLNKYLNSGIYILGIVTLYWFHGNTLTTDFSRAISQVVYSSFFAFIIFEQVFVANPLFNLRKLRFFDYWGKYTYGLYALHYIGILVAFNVTKVLHLTTSPAWAILGETTIALMVSLGIAWVSYRFLEKPFLKLKDRFSFFNTKKSQPALSVEVTTAPVPTASPADPS